MARVIKVWNDTTSAWEDVAVQQPDTSAFVSNSLISASKGALITSTGSAVDGLAPGANGETLVADSGATLGLRWQPNYNAGRNRIINGGFDVWQRGTSFTNSSAAAQFSADRWATFVNAGSITASRQAFTAGTAPVAGYEGIFFIRLAQTGSGSSTNAFAQRIEDVRTFAGQTVTLSYWAKASTAITIQPYLIRDFGSGGSAADFVSLTAPSLSSSWTRYTATVAVPSVSGKTIGAGSNIRLEWQFTTATTTNIDIWGVQVEAGSVATRFEEEPYEATLRKCQRYYYRITPGASARAFGPGGHASSTTVAVTLGDFPVTMRTRPTALEQSGTASDYEIAYDGSGQTCSAVPAYNSMTTEVVWSVNLTVSSGLTLGRGAIARANAATSYLGWSAEL